jgi:catechol 2,3-dioxygenase-like lactoylglutathione lyase family enzyme
MTPSKKARALGFNHIALEVGDVDEALAFYARIVDFKLRSKGKDMAFIDLGDQFLALQKGQSQPPGPRTCFEAWAWRTCQKSAKAIKELADKGMAPD